MTYRSREVTETEFREYLGKFNGRLQFNCVSFAEPPVGEYLDPTAGNWPDGIVAHCIMDDLGPGVFHGSKPTKDRRYWRYFVRETT